MAVKIYNVTKGSHAEKAGIKSGETLLAINSNEIVDVLDYRFYQVNRQLSLEISDGKNIRTVEINKGEYDEIGLEFETYLMDEQHSCRNKCIFCFIDQLPKGLRKSLYFKDDDSRLSFLFGNYITLTNITEHEIERIIKMHISPINVSVHTTNPELRCKMMNNRFAGEALKNLKRFADAGITLNCQIVACPGINDGDELLRTMRDLENLGVEMTAIVPVGLTAYRDGLYPLVPYNKETAAQTLDLIEQYGDMCKEKYGRRIFFAGDEFYILAEREIPAPEFYEDFSALEDGVGMIAYLTDDVKWALEEFENDEKPNHTVTVACGTGVYPFMKKIMAMINEKFPNITINTQPIKNNFFGGGVNVSGLVTGGDLINQLKGKNIGERLIIPSSMLRFENDLFLDDVSTDDVERELNVELVAVNNNGADLVNAIIF
ncbi:MAG TPA: radical SAM protein [Ruminococcus sp.]|nr:radical SAM protein [Ruminococcus sp.]